MNEQQAVIVTHSRMALDPCGHNSFCSMYINTAVHQWLPSPPILPIEDIVSVTSLYVVH